MTAGRAWLARFGGLFDKDRRDRELEAEIESHLAMHAEENRRAGMSPEEARRQAILKLGGVERTKESYRDRRGISWLETLLQDIRFGLRTLLKNPGFTAVAVLTLALGIGANTAVFSLLNAVMIRSLPYGDADRLVYVWVPSHLLPQLPTESLGPSHADFSDLQKESQSFSQLAQFDDRSFSLVAGGTAQHVGGARVSGDFFATLEVSPVLGRAIEPEDLQPGHEHVVVISDALWQSEFGGSASVLGKTLMLDGEPFQIVGVMPPAFLYPRSSDLRYVLATDKVAQVWLPLALTQQQAADRRDPGGAAIGRLRPGVSVSQAQAEMSAIVARVGKLRSLFPGSWYASVEPFLTASIGGARPLMWLLFGAVLLVLLIACGNAANLFLARVVSRMHEMGVRAALGAARIRLLRQMLTEAALLACGAGVLGILLAWLGIRVLLRFNPGTIPRLDETSIDGRVLLFSVVAALLTGILFGILPALTVSQVNPGELLKQGGNRGMAGTSPRLQRGLIVVEVGLAVILLAGAGFLIRSYAKLAAMNPGFSQSPLTMSLSLDARYVRGAQARTFFRNLLGRIEEVSGVQEAGAADMLPLTYSETFTTFKVEGYANKENQFAEAWGATEHYFDAMGKPLIEGRFFKESDDAGGPPPVIVNESFARTYFSDQDALGKHISLDPPGSKILQWSTVVGVVAGVPHLNLEDAPAPQIYTPFWRSDDSSAYIAIRTTIPPAEMIPAVRKTVQSIDPMLALTDIRTMEQRESALTALRRFQTFLLTVFAGIALLLAAIGLYGAIAYSMKQRTLEISVRVAVGAQRRDILKMVLVQGMTLSFLGLALGLAGAFGLTRLLAAMLYGITPNDPSTYVTVSSVLLAVSFVACYLPARRAMQVDPMVALRRE